MTQASASQPVLPENHPKRTFALVIGGMAVVLLVLAIRQCIGLANDDAFITYRYARNLAAGLGFVFNPGERVLGTTTPLYTLLLTPVGVAEDFLPLASNTFSCIGIAFQAWAMGRILCRLGAGRFVSAGAALFVLGGGIGSYWHVGLETNLLAALSIWSIERLLAARFATAGLLVGLATVCRFDAVLLAALLLFETVVHQNRTWRDGVSASLGFAVIVVPWLTFSTLYFGTPFPHSLNAKIHSVAPWDYALGGATQFVRALFTLVQSHSPTWMALSVPVRAVDILGIVVVAALLGIAIVKAWTDKEASASSLMFPWVLLMAYVAIGPPLEHPWHLYPAELLLFLGVVVGWLRLARWLTPSRWRPPVWFAWASVASIALAGFLYLQSFPAKYQSDFHFGPRARALAEMGRLIVERISPEKAISAKEVGIIGYLCRNPIIDRAGIVTQGLYYHNRALRTTLTQAMRLHPTDYVVADWIEFSEAVKDGQFGVLAAGRSPGYVRIFLLERMGVRNDEAPMPKNAR